MSRSATPIPRPIPLTESGAPEIPRERWQQEMNGHVEGPSRIDLRDGKAAQVGPGINVQFNDFRFSSEEPTKRPVRLLPARTVNAWDPFNLGIWSALAIPRRHQGRRRRHGRN